MNNYWIELKILLLMENCFLVNIFKVVCYRFVVCGKGLRWIMQAWLLFEILSILCFPCLQVDFRSQISFICFVFFTWLLKYIPVLGYVFSITQKGFVLLTALVLNIFGYTSSDPIELTLSHIRQLCSRPIWTYFVKKWKISIIECITYD